MSATLSKQALLERVIEAVIDGGFEYIIVSRSHPFRLRIYKGGSETVSDLCIYIWNCTHGGSGRADDEYRVQLTGVVPRVQPPETSLLLGWNERYGVFVGFDINKHAGQASTSPSIQIKEGVLMEARDRAFAAYDRANGEIAVAFRPSFLGDYATSSRRLHQPGASAAELVRLLSALDQITDRQLQEIKDPERRFIVSTIRRKYREADFRRRVLEAYAHKCAMCGLQLGLVEAAHIFPVAAVGSTDNTTNGIALCALHHRAFDQGLVSFDQSYRIEISSHRMGSLEDQKRVEGHGVFAAGLRPTLALPADPRDYPDPQAISRGREVRLRRL